MGDKAKKRAKETASKELVAARDPFASIASLRDWAPFGRLFRDLWDERALAGAAWSPAVDVAESDAAYTLTVEVPGAKREDVSVEVHGDVLEVRGEKRSEREEKDERRHVVERSYGSFRRSFALPANADADRVSASYKDGVLTVEIPKSAETKPKQVAIQNA